MYQPFLSVCQFLRPRVAISLQSPAMERRTWVSTNICDGPIMIVTYRAAVLYDTHAYTHVRV